MSLRSPSEVSHVTAYRPDDQFKSEVLPKRRQQDHNNDDDNDDDDDQQDDNDDHDEDEDDDEDQEEVKEEEKDRVEENAFQHPLHKFPNNNNNYQFQKEQIRRRYDEIKPLSDHDDSNSSK